MSEIETSWLKNISSGLKVLCLNAWQAKHGCENMIHYYCYAPINKEKISTQINSVASQLNPSTMVTTENVVDSVHLDDESSLTKQIDRTECCEMPSFDKETPLEVKSKSMDEDVALIDAAADEQQVLSSSLTSTSSSSSVSSIGCLQSTTSSPASSSTFSSSSNSSSRSDSSLGSENYPSSTSSSKRMSRRSNNSTTSENGGIQSKLLNHNFEKKYFNSLQSNEIIGSVTIEALNCIPWYECLYSHDKLCNFLKYPLSCMKLVTPSRGNLSIGQHHQEQKQCDSDPSHRSYQQQHSHCRCHHHHCDDQYHLFVSSSTSQFVHAFDLLASGMNILQDLLFSESLLIRLSTKDLMHISMTSCFARRPNEDDIYFILEEMFHWLPVSLFVCLVLFCIFYFVSSILLILYFRVVVVFF
ncbi:unnamed protein product [Trichobilharzia regenti]|nr:unnamed protein product [Trichobilharzia regenti]